MASNGSDPVTGAKYFPEEDALQSGADLEEVSAQAVQLGTRPIGTTTQMNAFPNARLKMRWGNTTDGLEYEHDGTSWVPVGGDPKFDVITYGGVYSAGTPTPRLTLLNGWYALEGVVTSSSATFVAGTGYTIGTIPSAKAPAATRTYPIMTNSVFGWVTVDSAGNVSIASSVGFTGALLAHINSARWPDKAL